VTDEVKSLSFLGGIHQRGVIKSKFPKRFRTNGGFSSGSFLRRTPPHPPGEGVQPSQGLGATQQPFSSPGVGGPARRPGPPPEVVKKGPISIFRSSTQWVGGSHQRVYRMIRRRGGPRPGLPATRMPTRPGSPRLYRCAPCAPHCNIIFPPRVAVGLGPAGPRPSIPIHL